MCALVFGLTNSMKVATNRKTLNIGVLALKTDSEKGPGALE